MQVLNLDAELNISRLDTDIRTLRLGEGGTTNYNDLTNKPSINSVILTGNKTTSDLNIKTSDLVNDAGFITNADIPTKTSDLINDDGFQTAAQVSAAVAAAIPTNVSAFTNDAGYITAAQVGNIPTKTSDLDNDSGFITSAEAPVQSVNGYTGTVNLVASDIEVSAGVTVADDLSILATSMPTKTSDLVNDSGFITSLNVPSKTSDLVNDSGFVTNQIDDSTTSDTTTWSSSKIASYIPQTETISDTPIASFTDGADNVPVASLIVDIDAVQAGSGVPSPDNVRPISGFSALNVTRTGKNWANNTATSQTINGIDYTVSTDGKITANNTASGASIIDVGSITLLGGNSYILSGCPSGGSGLTYALFLRGSGTFAQKIDFGVGISFTVTDTVTTTLSIIVYNGYTASNLTFEPMVRLSGTTADYEPYNGQTYNIPFGQTVYGGSLNVKTGVLTITHEHVDLGSLSWTYITSGSVPRFQATLSPNAKALEDNTKIVNAICDIYAINSWANITSIAAYDYNLAVNAGGNVITIHDSRYTDATAFTNALNGVICAYELATPTTIQLTPKELRTLLNDNNIFADTGNINELVYFKTGCEAIARLIEAYT